LACSIKKVSKRIISKHLASISFTTCNAYL
jgi:hypothetical protein